jgi:hypothetical protein
MRQDTRAFAHDPKYEGQCGKLPLPPRCLRPHMKENVDGYANGSRTIPKTVAIIINLLVGGAITVDQIDAVQ